MCFNLAASLIAGTVGMSAAAAIRGGLGAFIAWYSLIQFAEAAEYAGRDWRRAILLLLSSQLAVFTAVTWQPTPLYRALSLMGAATLAVGAVSPVNRVPLPAYGATEKLGAVLTAQYVGIFLGMLSQPKLRGAAAVLGGTAAVAWGVRGEGAASLWCFLSAVGAPLMLGQAQQKQ